MTLRSRVLAGLTFAFALIVVASAIVAISQRSELIGQLDKQLQAVVPLQRPPGGNPRPQGPPPEPGQDSERPVSNIFLAEVAEGGAVTVLSQGQLLDDESPDLTAVVGPPVTSPQFLTVDSTDGTTKFRVLTASMPDSATMIVAIPTTDVDDTMRRLAIALGGADLLIAATLSAVGWWVLRLGVRPITEMTTTARAIASGQRDQRAPELDGSTEAGQLAIALNSMLDQRDQADDVLRQFVSDASHELRTPLTSIRGYLDIYSQGGFRKPGQLDDAVRRMLDESERMTDLIENLLQLARSDEGQPLTIEPVDLGSMLTDLATDFASARGIDNLYVSTPEAGELIARVDRRKMQQVVVGLIDNAVTHAPGAVIRLSASQTDTTAVVTVADDGPGMSEAEASSAFDRFTRGDPARTRSTGGFGLGLAIAKSLVEAHGGTLELRTAPAEGTTFTVTVPLDSALNAGHHSANATTGSSPASINGGHLRGDE